MRPHQRTPRAAVVALAGSVFVNALTGPAIAAKAPERFSDGDLSGWQEKIFRGRTAYALVDSEGAMVLRARCDATASALYLARRVDLRQTPWLRWRWRVDHVFANVDEQSKQGDDFPARVYVVTGGGLLPWNTLAVNYVWASREPQGTDWSNAYTENAHMVALRSGNAQAKHWQVETRNVRQDFKRFHGKEVKRIDGVAVMTDCDDAGGRTESWYGDIEFLRRAPKGEQ